MLGVGLLWGRINDPSQDSILIESSATTTLIQRSSDSPSRSDKKEEDEESEEGEEGEEDEDDSQPALEEKFEPHDADDPTEEQQETAGDVSTDTK
jgi:hypothetical protein